MLASVGLGAKVAVADAPTSSAYQADAGHTGRLWGAGVLPPLTVAWSVPLQQSPWTTLYPVVSDGLAYVVDHGSGDVLAVALASGRIVWRQHLTNILMTGHTPFLTVDGGKLFVAGDYVPPQGGEEVETVEAFAAGMGLRLWEAHPNGVEPSPPVASGGVLYDDTYNRGGNRAAVRESDGHVFWVTNNDSTNPSGTYTGGPVTLAGQRLVGYDSCGGGVGTDIGTGEIFWARRGGCIGGSGGMLGTYAGGAVWFGDPDSGLASDVTELAGNRAIDPMTGDVVASFPGGSSPVFADGVAIQRRELPISQPLIEGPAIGGDLVGFDPTSQQTLWRFSGTSGQHDIATLPLAADGYVFAASVNGTLWALDPRTGHVVWSGQAPSGSGDVTPLFGATQTGLAAGDGYILLVTKNALVAFKGSGTPNGRAPSAWTKPPVVHLPPAPRITRGYWLYTAYGNVYSSSGTRWYGSPNANGLHVSPIVGMASDFLGDGYALASAGGQLYGFPRAAPALAVRSARPIIGVASASTPAGGDHLYTASGNVYAVNGRWFGSPYASGVHVSGVVGMATTTDGNGYWLVTSSGHVYGYGDAISYPAIAHVHPIKGIVGAPYDGYWLYTAYGNVYSSSGTRWYGSPHASGAHVPSIVGMAATPDGRGYWLASSSGRVYAYGDATKYPPKRPAHPIVGITSVPWPLVPPAH
jgi:outer membrane protein assembly factor BamB